MARVTTCIHTHGCKAPLLVKLPSLYKYIRFQRAIRAKSRRYMEERGERGVKAERGWRNILFG